jgi:tetratricopeptide (TPR) repeat protein
MKTFRIALSCVFSLAVCVGAVAQHEHHQEGTAPAELGAVHFENSCKPEVQKSFTRGVALLHSFWYDEAERQFSEVAKDDLSCGMAWWGVGMANWHQLWEPNGPSAAGLKAGQDAMQKAQAAGARTDREKAYIVALTKFYANAEKTPHLERVLAYEQAMDELHTRFAKDHEATIFYGLAMLSAASSAGPDKTYARQRKAGAMLEPLASLEPEHPGIEHYIIHAYDYPALAGQALAAARQYAKIAPDAPHALHMPSHIFTRMGLWQDSIESNLASAAAARKNGLLGDELHALDYLEFAYLQTGQDKLAQEVVGKVRKPAADDTKAFQGTYAAVTIPARYAVERRQWADAAALPTAGLPGGRYAWADATVYFVRALGAARVGKPEQARADAEKIAVAKQALIDTNEKYWTTQVEIQRRAADAWVQFAGGKRDEALAAMKSAVELEDTTDKHPVTPGSVVPMRALLGDMLLEMKRGAEAQEAFSKLMSVEPNRFAAVYGAARAAEMQGDKKMAAEMYRKLGEIAARGDGDREELKKAKEYLRVEAQR